MKDIDRNRNLPMYKQIENIIREMINEGTLRKDDCIPTELELMEKYSVSRITVRKSIMNLCKDELLYRIPGKGTFVKAPENESKTKIIGTLLNFADYNVASKLIHGAQEKAYEFSYGILIGSDNCNFKRQMEMLEDFISRGVRGIVLSPIPHKSEYKKNLEVIKKILSMKIPAVLIDRYIPNFSGLDYVGTDNFEGAKKLTLHLLERGHRKIAFIKTTYSSSVKDRLEGYKKALSKHGIKFNEALVKDDAQKEAVPGYNAARELLAMKSSERPSAVFVCHDIMANGVFKAASEAGIKIPDDLAVGGYDNSPEAESLGLTTVEQAFSELASTACELLIKTLENGRKTVQNTILQSKLIIRSSSGA